MARQYKKQSAVYGMSVSQILKMPESKFKSYSESDQREIVGRLVSAGNKRLRTFEKYGVESPAVIDVQESGGKFSTKGKDESGLLKELIRARAFFKNPTSTLKGWKKIETKMYEGLKEKGYDVNKQHMNIIAQTLGEISKHTRLTREMKYRAIYTISQRLDVTDADIQSLVNEVRENLDELYKQTQEDYINVTASDFFPVK